MTERCPACERPNCHCPVCNGTGRAQERGYSAPCLHCREVLVTRLRGEIAEAKRGLAAWEALAEWSKDPRGKRGWVAPVFLVVKDTWGCCARNDMSGDLDIEAFGATPTAAAIDLAQKLNLIPEAK